MKKQRVKRYLIVMRHPVKGYLVSINVPDMTQATRHIKFFEKRGYQVTSKR